MNCFSQKIYTSGFYQAQIRQVDTRNIENCFIAEICAYQVLVLVSKPTTLCL